MQAPLMGTITARGVVAVPYDGGDDSWEKT